MIEREGNRKSQSLESPPLRQPVCSSEKFSLIPSQQPAFRAIQDGKEILSHELPLQKAVATGQSVYDVELELVFQDGTRVNIIGNAVPLLDSEGRAKGAVGGLGKVTEDENVHAGEAF